MRGEGYANIVCDLGILRENNIPYSWNTLRVGKKYHLFNNAQIEEYAIEYFSEHSEETNSLIAELIGIDQEISIEDVLNKVADSIDGKIDPNSSQWQLEKRKLRFCILMYLKKHVSGVRELLDRIALVYNDFDFPKDMEDFIYYMPAKDFNPLEHSEKECIERLIGLFDDFLINEKRLLTNKL